MSDFPLVLPCAPVYLALGKGGESDILDFVKGAAAGPPEVANSTDLRPRRDAALEWWFAHGRVSSHGNAPVDFMISLFRQSSTAGGDGFMLLASAYDHASGTHSVRSEVTSELVDHFLAEAPAEMARAGVGERIGSIFLDEVRAFGPPLPVHRADRVELGDDALELNWGDVLLVQRRDTIAFGFDLPGGLGRLDLVARPAAAWLDREAIGAAEGRNSMAYQCCRRLALSGTLEGRRVTGEGWLDHQWGSHGWLRSDGERSRILGWNWFGINLSDGRDLMVCVRQDMESGQAVSSFAVWFDGDAGPIVVDKVRIVPRRTWLSPRSMTGYPLEWRIEVPSLRLSLDFVPAMDAQEIPVFGLINAIWEGIGEVSGSVAGRCVSGRARMGLNGYAFILDAATQQRRWVERIDRTLTAFLPEQLTEDRLAVYAGMPRWRYDPVAQTEMLSRPVWDLMSRGGKHWRPIYGFMLLEAFGVDASPYETLISIVPELIHTGTIIIDDIEDQSETRRGHPTVHRRYGTATALNAGNLLYFLPLLELAGHEALDVAQRDAIYAVITRMFVRGHLGQGQDIRMSKPGARGHDFWTRRDLGELILQTHAFKTASAVAAISEVAAIVARAEDQVTKACVRFGESWGVAFQILDDVNNFSSDPRWGKDRGEDITAGKATYAIWKAVAMLSPRDRDRLIAILDDPVLRTTETGLCEAIGLVERSGALDVCRDDAKALAEADWPAFRDALPHSQARIMLRVFVSNLTGLTLDNP
jgi:geranylgeranyl pyrophosphate synthase/predicted secreted hydrolase